MFVDAAGVDDQHVAGPGEVERPVQPEVIAPGRMHRQRRATQAELRRDRLDGRRQSADLSARLVQGRGRQRARRLDHVRRHACELAAGGTFSVMLFHTHASLVCNW